MNTSTKFRLGLLGFTAAVVLAGCFGADNVSSPGEGIVVGGGGSSSGNSGSSGSGGPATGCPTGLLDGGLIANGTIRSCQLPNLITGTLTLEKIAGVAYSINSRVQVGDDMGPNPDAPRAGAVKGVLNIAPGVKLFGSQGNDYLIISRGSQIFASGTVNDPIVFTSRQGLEGSNGVDSIGQWGGLVLAGRAPTNICPAGVTPPSVDCSQGQVEGTNAAYGGNTVNDNSGILKYIRIQYSGFEVLPAKELQGLTLAGVGNGTTIQYVQSHNSSDDGIEIFGGTVNLKHIILTGNDDDSLDTDNGYSGSVQFLIVKQRVNGGDRLFEMSSAGSADLRSAPKVANATLIRRSTAAPQGLELNTGTGLALVNSVIHNASSTTTTGIRIADAATMARNPTFNGVYMSGFATAFNADAQTRFNAGSANTSNGTSTLNDFVNGANENGVVAITGTPLSTISAFFTDAKYVGAVKDSNDTWWKGWSCSLDTNAC